MSETIQAENNAGASPARQMLAALTQASREMTGRFNEITERAQKLNTALENDVNKSLTEINKLSELIVHLQLEGLAAEKDSVLAELTVLRQQELEVLQTTARNLREALNEKLNELMTGLKDKVQEQVATLKQEIEKKESEVIHTEKSVVQSLRETLPDQNEQIQQKFAAEKQNLESLHYRHEGILAQETNVCLEKMREHESELKGRLARVQSNYLESMELTVREMVQALAEKLEKQIQNLSNITELAKPQLHAELDFLEKEPAAFNESARQIVDSKLQTHHNIIRNLAMVYSSEILSQAGNLEDDVIVLHARLQTMLRSYQESYAERSARLLAEFEQASRDATPAPEEKEKQKQEEVPAHLFEELRAEIQKVTRDIIPAAETEMEQSFSEFRSRLNAGSQKSCGQIEMSFHECRKKLMEAAELHKEELEELSQRGNALEQLVDEAEELIGAMNPSNLEF